ncbi:RTA1-domain-containing protein [Polychaeton citri CBS 116435]|uniref:RTA1-domain-containing protein n=1 Tax=Polychaeton citri CBS 116435 TaxID=1314669 RepID=A0A9P4UL19_9PEZI|nr:RTA1-domain-containing protein [Polychaeton citri CBS 116435]
MDSFSPLLARADPNQGCTQDTCSVELSVYGYRPFLSATTLFLIIFALSGIAHQWQGHKTKTWFFSTAMVLGNLSELLGYVAKLLLWNDPFSDTGFKMSVVLLTFAPAFYAAGIYYTLKHICLTFGSSFSRLRPSWYTYIFISCDVLSIVLQAIGGAVASAAEDDKVLKVGDNIMIAGLVTQVAFLLIFAAFVIDYAIAVYRNRQNLNVDTIELRRSMKFRLFIAALVVSYLCILVRCTYRVAELVLGWGPQNYILRDQGLFIGLDSVPCAIATLILNVWHPGWCFPKGQQDVSETEEKKLETGSSSGSEECLQEHAK